MTKILLKCLLLLILIGGLFGLVIYHPLQSYEQVKIIEKYYSPKPGEKLKGSKSKKAIALPTQSGQPTCAMEFDNGKILEMDCNIFLNYSIGEKVKIKYKKGRVLDIRRK
jgi:hypothetical protein